MNHHPLNITDWHRANLKKLADYLAALPEGYEHFSMEVYYESAERGTTIGPPNMGKSVDYEPDTYLHQCGSIACAVGHGPAAGVPVPPGCSSWNHYAREVFTAKEIWDDLSMESDLLYAWCFEGLWSEVDNTPQGAARRIYYALEHGVPDNFAAQVNGREPLCYYPSEETTQ